MATNTKNSLSHLKTDPLRNFKFVVSFPNKQAAFGNMGFMSVQGLNVSTEVIPYREGGMNTTTQKMPGQSDFSAITLTKGLAVGDQGMMKWMSELFHVMQGSGNGGAGNDFRTTVDIKVLAHPVTNVSKDKVPVKAWFRVYNAWPTAVSFSDLDAGANAIVVNSMTLAHEGFEFKLDNNAGPSSVSFR